MGISITPGHQACGAEIRGLDLSRPLSPEQVATIQAAWLQHRTTIGAT